MKYLLYPFILFLTFWCTNIAGQNNSVHSFQVIPLGVYGGIDESNLSCYMIATSGSKDYICLDAGTLHDGIGKAIQNKIFKGDAQSVLKNNIKGYLISHPHLDHVAGLVINSPDDTVKNIYALPFCLNILEDKYFNWQSWINFGDEGEKPLLKKYHYVSLNIDSEIALANTNMYVKAFELSHSNPYKSTAFLIRCQSSYALYLGDTGADSIEKSTRMRELWEYIGPLIKANQLKGIFIEVSFPDEEPVNKLFGHLTPTLFIGEMHRLAILAGINNLASVPIIITHIKPLGNNEKIIINELHHLNDLHLKFIFPKQGKVINL